MGAADINVSLSSILRKLSYHISKNIYAKLWECLLHIHTQMAGPNLIKFSNMEVTAKKTLSIMNKTI